MSSLIILFVSVKLVIMPSFLFLILVICLLFFFLEVSLAQGLSIKKIFLLIYFWLCWVFVAALWLSLVVASQGYSLLQYPGFSLWWLLLLQSLGSRAHMLQ